MLESVEEFQIRKANYVIEEMLKNGEPLKRWKILSKAGLNGLYSNRVAEDIDKVLAKYDFVLHQITLFYTRKCVRS